MDPITLIVTALAAGASKVGGELAGDAYHSLVSRLRKRFSHDDMAQQVLDKHADAVSRAQSDEASRWEPVLKMYLEQARAGENSDVLAAAQAVVDALHDAHGSTTSYSATAGAVHIGDNAQVHVGRSIGSAEISTVTSDGRRA